VKVDETHRLMFWLTGVTKKKKLAYFVRFQWKWGEIAKIGFLVFNFLAGNSNFFCPENCHLTLRSVPKF